MRRWLLAAEHRGIRTLLALAFVALRAAVGPQPGDVGAPFFYGLLAVYLVGAILLGSASARASGLAALGATTMLIASVPLIVEHHPGLSLALLLLATADAGLELKGRRMVPALAAAAILSVALGLARDQPVLLFLGCPAGAAGLAIMGRERRLAAARARQSEGRLQETELAHREAASTTAREERHKVARDLHDVLAHSLSAISVRAEVVLALFERGAPRPALAESLEALQATVAAGSLESRQIVATLRGDPLDPDTFLAALRETADGTATFDVDIGTETVAPETTATLFRIAQEGLSNARRHGVGTARLVIRADEAEVSLEIRNPVGARDSDGSSRGYGLIGMRERAEAVDGRFSAGVEPDGEHWVLRAELPLTPAEEPVG